MSDKPLSGLRILVVEDDALLAMTVDSILQNAGAEIAGPGGSSEAEQLAAAGPLKNSSGDECDGLGAVLAEVFARLGHG